MKLSLLETLNIVAKYDEISLLELVESISDSSDLSEKNNTEEKVLETFSETLKDNNISFDNVLIARQNEPTKVIEI